MENNMIQTKITKQCVCPECGYIWYVNPYVTPEICKACGHGLPEHERRKYWPNAYTAEKETDNVRI